MVLDVVRLMTGSPWCSGDAIGGATHERRRSGLAVLDIGLVVAE
jgi:hypothetical protein